MHPTVLDFTKKVIDKYKLNNVSYKVLEVGAQDINGSVRPLFHNIAYYTGMDMQAGPGVDIVANAHDIPFDDKLFNLVVCCETLEHDDQFWLTLKEINRVLKFGGYFLLTARGNNTCNETMFEHGFPYDYYRFMPQSFPRLFEIFGFELLELEEDTYHPGWLGLGRKL